MDQPGSQEHEKASTEFHNDDSDAFSSDHIDLYRVGKKPVLKRNFGFFPTLGFGCTVLICWEGLLSTFSTSFLNGGSGGVVWGFLIVWVGTMSTFLTVSELASMAPTSGGQYHWASLLAPEGSRKFFSYITGWMTFIGWQAAMAAGGPFAGGFIFSIAQMCNPDFEPTTWQRFLLSWAIYLFAVSVNVTAGSVLASYESAILVIHIIGFFAVMIPLVVLGDHKSASEVFLTFINEGNWSTQGVSFFVGVSGTLFVLVGADSAVHMSEEVKRASIVVPRALMLGLVINGTLAFAMIIAVLFCLGPVEAFLDSELPFPFVYVFQQAVRSNAGAAVMAAIPTSMAILGQVSTLATASRQLWAFSRDKGVPFWRHVSKVDKRTTMPLYAVGLTATISALLSLIVLGSDLVFEDIISIVVVGLYSSYLLVCGLLLWRRTTGAIAPWDEAQTVVRPGRLMWGRWRLPPALGVANNVFAICYLAVMFVWAFFPTAVEPTPETMSYSSLVYGAVVIFSVLWYLLVGRHEFDGPVVEVHLDEGRD